MGHCAHQPHSGVGNELARKAISGCRHDVGAFHVQIPSETERASIRRYPRQEIEMLSMTLNEVPEFIDILQQNRMVAIVEHQAELAGLQ